MKLHLHPRLACGLALAAALAGFSARAAAPEPSVHDQKALELLGDVARAYQALPAYTDQGSFVQSLSVNGKPQTQTMPIRLSMVRPNKLAIDAGEVRVISDGKTLTTVLGPYKRFTTVPAPKSIRFETFRDGPLGSILFGGPSAPTSAIFLSLLAEPDAIKALLDRGGTFKVESDREEGGKTLHSLLIDLPRGADFRLLIDPVTKLLKGIDWVLDPKEVAAGAPPGQSVAFHRIGWSAGEVSTRAPDKDAFAFQPPRGFTRIEAMARAAGDDAKSPVLELVGKPAPDFTITVLDGPGKTRTIAKADLAGKVVLIDFWATWCAPCLEELPEIQKLIEAYAKEDKQVVIIAQNLDEKPRDLGELRKKVEETFRERKVDLSATKVGLVALDPSGTVGEAFKVESIPCLVILDGQGTVQSAYDSKQDRETLAKDLDALLAGKSLLKTRPQEAGRGATP